MTKKKRTLLFYSLTLLFLFLVPVFILYSQGYRINWDEKRPTQTGAFFFKVEPKQADIIINGEAHKRTDFFFGSALTKNFFPGTYSVEITKEGYHSWQKTLPITEQTVTEAKYITLFKQDIPFTELENNVEELWMAPSRRLALVLKSERASWELSLFNLATGTSIPMLEPQRPEETIVSVQWSLDSQRFLVLKRASGLTLAEIHGIGTNDACSETPCSLSYLGAISDITFSPASRDIVLFTKTTVASRILAQSSYVEKQELEILASNVLSFEATGTSLLWLNRNGALLQRQLTPGSETSPFQESTFEPQPWSSYTITAGDNIVLVKEDSTVFLHEKGTVKRTELLSPVTTMVASPQGEKVALANEAELWVLFVKEDPGQPQRAPQELVLLTRFSEPIRNLSWINPFYLLFSLGDTVKASEIDTRGRVNITDLGNFPKPEVFYENNILYVLSKGALSASDNIVR